VKHACQSEISIIGGGLVGYTAALAFAQAGFTVNIFESKTNDVNQLLLTEGRAISLAYTSCLLYRALGLWPSLSQHATPIHQLVISQEGSFGKCHIDAADFKVNALGYVVPATQIAVALFEAVKHHQNIHLISPCKIETLTFDINVACLNEKYFSQLVLACDGTESFARHYFNMNVTQKNYEQTAIVANVSVSPAMQNCAVQRFSDGGVLALLPLGGHTMTSALTVSNEQVNALQLDNPERVLDFLQNVLGTRQAKLSQIGSIFTYPLQWMQAESVVHERLVLLGNAAHTISPIAAQGLNLALRDLAMLYDIIQQAPERLGNPESLKSYAEQSAQAQKKVLSFTDNLTDWLTPRTLKPLRSAGLFALDHLPFFKKNLALTLMGFSSHGGSLMRGDDYDW
jgi:2-octaprenyl-6-methoxyphenol hydroxylase